MLIQSSYTNLKVFFSLSLFLESSIPQLDKIVLQLANISYNGEVWIGYTELFRNGWA